tara:strand:+ start:625 stop:1137 length:513 start_codon:yes stop_codon:yes gene_type:complete
MTYTLIDSVTLTSSASSVTFSSISATGKGDLVLVINAKVSNNSYGFPLVRFNSDSGSNYSYVGAYAESANTYSEAQTNSGIAAWDPINGNPIMPPLATIVHQIMDFSATDKHKAVITRSNNSSVGTGMFASRWANTSAISSMVIEPTNGTTAGSSFDSGGTFFLYQLVSE